MDGAGLRAVVAGDDERGVVVEQPDLPVAAHAHRCPGRGDLSLDPGVGGTGTGEVVGVREVRALHREVDVAGPGEHLGGHHRRLGPGLSNPRSHRFPGRIGHQTARLADPEFGQPPVGAPQGTEELPRGFPAHGEVFVPGLLAHLARLDAHGKAEPQSRHGDDRPAFRVGEGRDRGIPPGDPARGFHRIRQPHHRIGGCDRELGRPPASHHVTEVDQPPQAVAVERRSHHHVVVVGVVVNHRHGKRVANRVQPADGAAKSRGHHFGSVVRALHGVRAVQVRADRPGRGFHPPREVAVEFRVVEAGQGRVQLGQERAEGLQHRHRTGAHLRQREPVHVRECAGNVRGAIEVDVRDGRPGRSGDGGGGRAVSVGRGHQARYGGGEGGSREVVQTRGHHVEHGPPRRGAELEHEVACRYPGLRRAVRDDEVEVEFARQSTDFPGEPEVFPGNGGRPRESAGHGESGSAPAMEAGAMRSGKGRLTGSSLKSWRPPQPCVCTRATQT